MNRRENFLNFLKNHKKLVAILSVVFIILITIIILIFTTFSLKEISINLKTETKNITQEVQEQIIQEVREEGFSTVLFADKEKLIRRLEKDFPYLKIVNIETVIPSSFVIHCLEREELYAIESNDKVFFLDEDLKVLRIKAGSFDLTESTAVLLNIADLELNLQTLEEGQFFRFNEVDGDDLSDILANNVQMTLTSLLTSFEENNRNISILRGGYSEVKINFDFKIDGENKIWYVCLSLIDNSNFETVIVESDKYLSEKIAVMLTIVNDLSENEPEKLLTHILIIERTPKGQFNYLLEGK